MASGGGAPELVWRSEDKPLAHFFVVGALLAFLASKMCEITRKRRRLARFLLASLLLALTLSSCRQALIDPRGKLKLIEGNFFASRGMNVEAISAFLDAGEREETAPYAEFALATTYLAMNELDSALNRFESARNLRKSIEKDEFNYRLYYNSGVVYFNMENFLEAADCFKRALAIDPRRIDAKRNLELSQWSITRKGGIKDEVETNTMRDAAASSRAGRDALMEFFRQKEQDKWKSREWTDDSGITLPDY
jgi:tetratricopeptide (TPR) repeat protein